MTSLQFLSQLIEQYGLYAVFFLTMIEGDITLLLAGVLAHSAFFGDYSFARVLLWGTLGGVASDIYGLRWASCIFYGVSRMRYVRFLPLSIASCFAWVFILSGVGYFFSSAVIGLIGDFRHVGKILLVIVLVGVLAFYWVKRLWLSKKVEEVAPERLQEIEQAAIEGFKELKDEIREKIHLK